MLPTAVIIPEVYIVPPESILPLAFTNPVNDISSPDIILQVALINHEVLTFPACTLPVTLIAFSVDVPELVVMLLTVMLPIDNLEPIKASHWKPLVLPPAVVETPSAR
jgi:hypothetical protein